MTHRVADRTRRRATARVRPPASPKTGDKAYGIECKQRAPIAKMRRAKCVEVQRKWMSRALRRTNVMGKRKRAALSMRRERCAWCFSER